MRTSFIRSFKHVVIQLNNLLLSREGFNSASPLIVTKENSLNTQINRHRLRFLNISLECSIAVLVRLSKTYLGKAVMFRVFEIFKIERNPNTEILMVC